MIILIKLSKSIFICSFPHIKLIETKTRGSDFIFDCVNLLYYKDHKINFKRGGSYIDSPDCIKKNDNKPQK